MDAFDSYLAVKQAADDDNNGMMMGAMGLGAGAVGVHLYNKHQQNQMGMHAPAAPASKFDTFMGKARQVTGMAHEVAGLAKDVAPYAIAGGAALGAAAPGIAKKVQPHIDNVKGKVEAAQNAWNAKMKRPTPTDTGHQHGPGTPQAEMKADFQNLGAEAQRIKQHYSPGAGMKRLWNDVASVGNMEIGPKKLTTGFKLPKFKIASAELPYLLVEAAIKEGCDVTNAGHLAMLRDELATLKQAALKDYLEADLFEKAASAESLPAFMYSCEVVEQGLAVLQKRAAEEGSPFPKADGVADPAAPSEFAQQVMAPAPAHADPVLADPYYGSARRMNQAFTATIGAGLGTAAGVAGGLALHHHLPPGMARDASAALPTLGGLAGFYAGYKAN